MTVPLKIADHGATSLQIAIANFYRAIGKAKGGRVCAFFPRKNGMHLRH
jgi:hypothetical protein